MNHTILGAGLPSYPAGVILLANIYAQNLRPAFKLVCADDGTPYASLTVNVPEVELAEDEILVSADWNLPPDIKSVLLASGKFERTARSSHVAFASYDVWRVVDAELLAEVASLRPDPRHCREALAAV